LVACWPAGLLCPLGRHRRRQSPMHLAHVSSGAHHGHELLVPSPGDATASRAVRKCPGNVLPRFCARRRIPAAAFQERKKRGGTSGSKTSDNEHAAAPLGDSEVSRVQHSPANAIPEVGQRRENDGEIAATVGGKKSGNVLKQEPAGLNKV